jgi:hypothetical protein
LSVTSSVKLNGVLTIMFANPIVPQLGDSFQIVTAGKGLTGQFTQIVAPTLGWGLGWSVLYTSNAATLQVVQQPSSGGPLEYLNRWRQSFGVNAAADLDGDGDTDGNDLLIWQRQLVGSSSASARAVPEPTTLGLIFFAAAIVGATRRLP